MKKLLKVAFVVNICDHYTGSGPLKFWSVTRRDSIQIKIIVK